MAPPAPIPSQAAAASEALVRQQLAAIRARVQYLGRKLDTADLTATAGKRVSKIFSLWYGPIAQQTARRNAAGAGHELLAPLVSTDQFLLPFMGTWHVGREGAFYWLDTNVFTYLNWSYTALPGGGAGPVDARPQGGLFDSVLGANGGGMRIQNHFLDTIALDFPRVCFDLDLYDRQAGRGLSNVRMSGQVFAGLTFGFRPHGGPRRMDPDAEVEPRLYVTECRMGGATTATAVYNASQVRAYVNLVVRGYTVLE